MKALTKSWKKRSASYEEDVVCYIRSRRVSNDICNVLVNSTNILTYQGGLEENLSAQPRLVCDDEFRSIG